jgi:ligand-binding sensor domain-containing protein
MSGRSIVVGGTAVAALLVATVVWILAAPRPGAPVIPPGWMIIRPPHEVSALAIEGDTVWAGGDEGVFLIDRGSGNLRGDLPHDPPFRQVRALLLDRQGRLWIGTQAGLWVYDGGAWRTFDVDNGLPDMRVNSLMEDEAGQIWVGTWSGAARWDGGGWSIVTTVDGLLEDMVNVIMEDREGCLWFGSYVAPRGGISVRCGDSWQHFTTEHGLPHNNVTSILEDTEGRVWVGTGLLDRGGAATFAWDEGRWRMDHTWGLEDGLAGEKVRSLFEDTDGFLWIGSEYDGVALYQEGVRGILSQADGLADPEVKVMIQDEDGNLWLGTRDGLTRITAQGLSELHQHEVTN